MTSRVIWTAAAALVVVVALDQCSSTPARETVPVHHPNAICAMDVHTPPADALQAADAPQLADAMIAWALAAEDHDARDRAHHYAAIIEEAIRQRPGIVDEHTLAALTWVETRWRSHVVSDAGACGWTQILPDGIVDGRPSCADLQTDDLRAAIWTLDHLDERRGMSGEVRPCRYLGACQTPQAIDYERRVWRAAGWMRMY